MPQSFFNGNHPGEHICSCGENNECLDNGVENFKCNCDANLPFWALDDGIITSKDILPITQVFYGPLLYDAEKANFTIGRFKCAGEHFFY